MQEKKKKTPKRLILNIDDKLHAEIKKRALYRYQTLSNWVLIAIQERINEEKSRE